MALGVGSSKSKAHAVGFELDLDLTVRIECGEHRKLCMLLHISSLFWLVVGGTSAVLLITGKDLASASRNFSQRSSLCSVGGTGLLPLLFDR